MKPCHCGHFQRWHRTGYVYTRGEFTYGSTGTTCLRCIADYWNQVEERERLPWWRRPFARRVTAFYEHGYDS